METWLIEKHEIIVNVSKNIIMNEFGHIYLLTNKINNKKYVGQSTQVRKRFGEHIRRANNGENHPICDAFNEYGINNFEFAIIDSASNISELDLKKIVHTNIYKSNIEEFGYNYDFNNNLTSSSEKTNIWVMKKHNINVNIKLDITLDEFGHIYLIINKLNNKKYVGQSIRVKDRLYEHILKAKNNEDHILYHAFNKHNLNNFEFNIIDYATNIDELNEKEINYINKYKSNIREFGYNIENGGKNSLASLETKLKLSLARKDIKQNKEWIEKRINKVSKPVLKINKNNEIVEKFKSLADAGRLNSDNLSYEAILRKCLGISKNKGEYYWCYECDFLNNELKDFKSNIFKKLEEFTDNELLDMYNEHMNSLISIRELSKKYSIRFSILLSYIEKKNKKENVLDLDSNYIAVCKKTNKKFEDYLNKSGVLTRHIQETYPEENLESKYLRKKIELETGHFWYAKFFDFIEIKK